MDIHLGGTAWSQPRLNGVELNLLLEAAAAEPYAEREPSLKPRRLDLRQRDRAVYLGRKVADRGLASSVGTMFAALAAQATSILPGSVNGRAAPRSSTFRF